MKITYETFPRTKAVCVMAAKNAEGVLGNLKNSVWGIEAMVFVLKHSDHTWNTLLSYGHHIL